MINYGYGCACVNVTVVKDEEETFKIHSATARPLSACRTDIAIKAKDLKESSIDYFSRFENELCPVAWGMLLYKAPPRPVAYRDNSPKGIKYRNT